MREYSSENRRSIQQKLVAKLENEFFSVEEKRNEIRHRFDNADFYGNRPDWEEIASVEQELKAKSLILNSMRHHVLDGHQSEALLKQENTLESLYQSFIKEEGPLSNLVIASAEDLSSVLYNQKDDLDAEIEDVLVRALDGVWYLDREGKDSNSFVNCIYHTPDDKLSDSALADIQNSDDPQLAFMEAMNDIEDYYQMNEGGPIHFDDLEMSDEEETFINANVDVAQQFLDELVHYSVDEEHYLAQTIRVNVMLATEFERNDDMMCLGPYAQNRWAHGDEYRMDNSLFKLAEAFWKRDLLKEAVMTEQPVDERGFRKKHSDAFVESCLQELENNTYDFGGLTLLTTMSVADFIKLKESEGNDCNLVTFPKGTTCGIFNPWNGSGGPLEIDIPDDFVVSGDMIYAAWVDGLGRSLDAHNFHYELNDTYGLVSSEWTDFGNSVTNKPFADANASCHNHIESCCNYVKDPQREFFNQLHASTGPHKDSSMDKKRESTVDR